MEMNLKSKNPAQCDYTRPMSRSVWRLKLCSVVLIVCILTAPARAEGLWWNIYPFNIGATPSQPFIAKSPKTDLSRQLWQARITIAEDTKTGESKNELQRIIREVNSVDFKSRQQTPAPLITLEPIRKTDPNETATDKEMPQEDKPIKIERKLPYRRVSDETLEALKSLSQHPEKLHNPLELGEILFSSHCLKEAAKCYQEAINRMTAGKAVQARDAAWLLFQTGNCLRQDDPATAVKMYEQLIVDYPDSPWAPLAEAKSELVGWYAKDTPDKLIAEYK